MGERKMIPIIDSYNIEDLPMYIKPYLFIKGYAVAKNMRHTLRALPLCRTFHNGQYRKATAVVNGNTCRLPYVLHVLKVCSTLISLHLPLTDEELDILCCCALLHDSLEDADEFFPKNGEELVSEYGFPEMVLTTIKLLSKYAGASQVELSEYFNAIKRNKFALLVKLADRSHNVEDLYNMKLEKLHKYVRETRDFIYPLCSYGKQTYPELSDGVTVLKSKILSLTELTETIVEQYEEKLNEKEVEIAALKEQLEKLQSKTE